jgi:integrating conjugative element protein (TIGR03765 family)
MKSVLMCLLLISSLAIAKPEVIADFGGKPTGIPDIEKILRSQPVGKPSKLAPVMDPFPIESNMRVGKVAAFEHGKPVNKPFAIIGADSQSLRWLSINQAYFVEERTTVYITNVRSLDEFNNIKGLFPGVMFAPVNPDDLAELFGVDFYPVFINKTSVQQ